MYIFTANIQNILQEQQIQSNTDTLNIPCKILMAMFNIFMFYS